MGKYLKSNEKAVIRGMLCSGVAVVALAATCGSAGAGGFAVREQSSSFLGMAFAGAAAGGDLSSSFWNPAAFGTAQRGLATESHYSAIFGDTEISGTAVSQGSGVADQVVGGIPVPPPFNAAVAAGIEAGVDAQLAATAAQLNAGGTSTSIDRPAVLAASYGAYRISDKLVLGISMNSPFGLSTEPDNPFYSGGSHGLNSSLLTFNAAPTVSYEVMRGVHIAAGIQLEYADLRFKFRRIGAGTVALDLKDEVGVGYTAGVLLQPFHGTSFGVGFRSKIEHDFVGDLYQPGIGLSPATATLETPEIVTVSLSQALTPQFRAHLTYEWTNWGRFDSIPVGGTAALDVVSNQVNAASPFGDLLTPSDRVLDGPWEDGHFFSGGLEYDFSQQLTLRTGIAYERSPIQTAEARLLQVPDSDRVWLSLGVSYRWSEMTTIDFGYTHIFFEDAQINRAQLAVPALAFQGKVENSADIVSVSLKTKWGESGLQETVASLLGGGF